MTTASPEHRPSTEDYATVLTVCPQCGGPIDIDTDYVYIAATGSELHVECMPWIGRDTISTVEAYEAGFRDGASPGREGSTQYDRGWRQGHADALASAIPGGGRGDGL